MRTYVRARHIYSTCYAAQHPGIKVFPSLSYLSAFFCSHPAQKTFVVIIFAEVCELRFLTTTAVTAGLLACIGTAGQASEVREKEYGYRYGDTVNSMQEDAFVVCGDCGVDKLSKLPKAQVVTVAMMQPSLPQESTQPETTVAEWPPRESYSDTPMVDGTTEKQVPSEDCGPSCLLETVLFKFDSDKFGPAEAKKLDRLLEVVPDGAALTVTGYTCEVGATKYNKGLSRRRADAVARYLTARGAKVLSVTGEGECCPASNKNKLNRRVEITKKEKN